MWTLISALAPFAIAMSISPGPNNLMVTASAANFGLRRTLPHMIGITVGFPVMLIAVGIGLGGALEALPRLHAVLKYLGAAYLLYLAWRVGAAGGPDEVTGRQTPLSLIQAALFQWVNPKAWIMALSAVTTFTTVGGDAFRQILLISAVFAVVAFPSVAIWAAFGTIIARLLRSRISLRVFNISMALLLVASVVAMFV